VPASSTTVSSLSVDKVSIVRFFMSSSIPSEVANGRNSPWYVPFQTSSPPAVAHKSES
jgi:hypothetical protein